MERFELRLLCAAEAIEWMSEPENAESWRALEKSCAWSTPFLTFDFARIWLDHYKRSWQPLLVLSRDTSGHLHGLMPLAMRDGEITGMGAAQAEYQGWLCDQETLAGFPKDAINLLFDLYPDACLRLRYLNFGAASKKALAVLEKQANIMLDSHARPLLTLDEETISASLRKKSNKSKWNRLKRLGHVEFDLLESEQLADAPLSEIIALYDFRQGAINGDCPFMEDPNKEPFHQQWMKESPSQLILFRLSLGGRTIGAMLGVLSSGVVSNAIVAHSPELASHSPGKFVIYLAAQEMSRRGYQWLDLTPGGDPWKERFADTHDSVLELRAWRHPTAVLRQKMMKKMVAGGKKLARSVGTEPEQLRIAWRNVTTVLRQNQPVQPSKEEGLDSNSEYLVYSGNSNDYHQIPVAGSSPNFVLNRNSLHDLLMFEDNGSPQNRSAFLRSALQRLERGQTCFTVCDNGALLFCCWIANRRTVFDLEKWRESHPQVISGVEFHEFYTHPLANGRDLLLPAFKETVSACVRPIFGQGQDCDTEGSSALIYIAVAANQPALRQMMTKLSFRQYGAIAAG